MAKAGFWLRGAKGKLAGASMQKGANGQTIMREIVIPKNPKTNAQIYQRAIMATVNKLAAAGAVIFDHSYEGVEVGTKCLRMFVKQNIAVLRGSIAHNLEAPNEGGLTGACVGPKTGSFIPIDGAFISKGSYNVPDSFAEGLKLEAWGNETPEAYYAANGLVPGDFYTIVCCYQPYNADTQFVVRGYTEDDDETMGFTQYSNVFAFIRLQVKPIPAAKPQEVTYGSIFTVSAVEGLVNTQYLTSHSIEGLPLDFEGLSKTIQYNGTGSMLPSVSDQLTAMGVIRSRLDADLRSTSKMNLTRGAGEGDFYYGITTPYILEAWRQGTVPVGDSDLILEGGNG